MKALIFFAAVLFLIYHLIEAGDILGLGFLTVAIIALALPNRRKDDTDSKDTTI